MTELASDLVFEIFARVPVKDLLRFRCVCKSWRSLFQDESFIRRHATRAPSMFLLVPWQLDTPHSTCTYESLRLISQEPEVNNDEEKSLLFRADGVISHCNGLFCLRLPDNSLAVWNPALRELRKVPKINQLQNWSRMGFGYDHSTQDHKIVLMQLGNRSRAQVLTLKSNVSRMIDFPWRKKCKILIRERKEGILVGENIFWPLYARQSTIENGEDILTFSVVSETFNYCSGPSETQVHRALKVLRGSLCAVERERGDYCNDMVVWCAEHEKEDQGRIKSWSKILRLTASDIFRPTRWLVDEFRLEAVINQTGLLLIIVRTREKEIKLCEYNLEEDTVRPVETTHLGYLDNLQEYIATLVPTRAY